MKIIIAVTGLALFIQTFCVFEALTLSANETDCSSHNEADCCGVDGCELYNCTSQNAPVDAETVCGKAAEYSCQGNKTTLSLCNRASSLNDTTTESSTIETTTNGTTPQVPVNTTTQAPVTTTTQAQVNTTTQAPTTTATNGTGPTSVNTTELTTTEAGTSSVTARTEATSAASGNPFAPTSAGDSGRHFDAASFIGGIVLCLGLMVIVFIGLKFYRSRSQQNYRTL